MTTTSGLNAAMRGKHGSGRVRSIAGGRAEPDLDVGARGGGLAEGAGHLPVVGAGHEYPHASCRDQPEPLAAIDAVAQRLPPVATVEIPPHRLLDAGLEGLLRAPAELGLELGRIDGVALVVARVGRRRR